MTNSITEAAQGIAGFYATLLGADPLPSTYVVTTHRAIRETAAAYAQLPKIAAGDLHAWHAMASEVDHQFAMLERAGFDLQVCDENPYDRAIDLFEAVGQRWELHVLSTAATGGHPVWSDAQNDRFRAVHDFFGHCRTGRGFDKHGEEAAYQSHVRMFSSQARLAMATETRGQNHAMNALLLETGVREFAEERIAILPPHIRAIEHTVPTSPLERDELIATAQAYDARIGIA